MKTTKFHLWTVHHPDLTEVWILPTKSKCIKFVEKNEETWMKYGMDTELFTFNKSYVRDTKLINIIKEGLPELFL